MIECKDLVKIFHTGQTETVALQGLDLQVKQGEMLAVIGASGSGKSTLLNIIGCLDRPDAGQLMIDNTDVLALPESSRVAFRMKKIGFVWQNTARNLIPHLTAMENCLAPMRLAGQPNKQLAKELLGEVGLEGKENRTLFELSGGEQQRVAIAAALANQPALLLADEPTGSVDSLTCDHLMDLFRRINRDMGKTIVIVTHDEHLSSMVDRVVAIRDGRTSSELIRTQEGNRLSETHREFSLLDKTGRVQIPREVLERSGIKGNQVVFEVTPEGILMREAKAYYQP